MGIWINHDAAKMALARKVARKRMLQKQSKQLMNVSLDRVRTPRRAFVNRARNSLGDVA